MECNEQLDKVLKELAAIRTILEGLMQPLVIIDPANPHHEPLDPTALRPGSFVVRGDKLGKMDDDGI